MISETIRQRYLRDPLPVRLGGLAADLARAASFAGNARNREAVLSVLEEGKHFAEWAAADAPLAVQSDLAEVQILLAWWERRLRSGTLQPGDIRRAAEQWAERLLQLSGLAAPR